MSRVLIAYDTRYGSTERVAQWIAEGIAERGTNDISVDVKNVLHVTGLNHDGVVIGSPIYDDELLNSVIAFLDAQSDTLEHVNIALFVVCGHYGALPKDKLINMYVKKLEAHISGTVVAREVFGGSFDFEKLSDEDKRAMEDFSKGTGHTIAKLDLLDRDKVQAFGRELKNLLVKGASAGSYG